MIKYMRADRADIEELTEMLDIRYIRYIELYGSLGIAYFDLTAEELAEDLATLNIVGSVTVC